MTGPKPKDVTGSVVIGSVLNFSNIEVHDRDEDKTSPGLYHLRYCNSA